MIDVLTGMRVFVAVVDAGSFSSAADKVSLSRGMTSRYVAQIETHLGVRLLNRTTRRLSLTGAGQDYYQRAVEVLALVAEAEDAAISESAQPQGRLRINAPLSFSTHHLGRAIAEYLVQCPKVNIDLSLIDRKVNLVGEGFDVVLRIAREVDPVLIARPIADIRVFACASPEYLRQRGMPESPESLTEHNCLTYTHEKEQREWTLVKGRNSRSVQVSGNLQGNNGDALCRAAIAGLGVILQPSFLTYKYLRSGELVRVLPDWEVAALSLYMVYSSRQFMPLKVRSFIDFMVEYFGKEPYWDDGL